MNKVNQSVLIGYDLLLGEAKEQLASLSDESFKLIITSPPYNIGKEYEKNEFESIDQYLKSMEDIVELLVKKVSIDGSICWQVGNYVNGGEIVPLDVLCYNFFKKRGMKLRNRIIWRFNFGLHSSRRFSGRYETLLWFTKSDDYTFNLDPVRIPQIYPGKRHSASKGSLAGLPSGNPMGKNPSDYWEFIPSESFRDGSIWDIPNVKSNHPEKTIHPCQFPVELVERCVLALTSKGDTVLDPFVGTGTSIIAALKNGRNACGIDREYSYIQIAEKRIRTWAEGKLKLRPLGKPVHIPGKKESVAQIPKEWVKPKGKKSDGTGKKNRKKEKKKTTYKRTTNKIGAKRSKARS